MPQTLSPSPAELRLATVTVNAPRWRSVLVALTLLLGAGTAGYIATTLLQPAIEAPQASGPAGIAKTGQNRTAQNKTAMDKAAIAALDLSAFQRRGNFLVGETTTEAGVRLRLVLDARSHELVGMRVVETEAGAAR